MALYDIFTCKDRPGWFSSTSTGEERSSPILPHTATRRTFGPPAIDTRGHASLRRELTWMRGEYSTSTAGYLRAIMGRGDNNVLCRARMCSGVRLVYLRKWCPVFCAAPTQDASHASVTLVGSWV